MREFEIDHRHSAASSGSAIRAVTSTASQRRRPSVAGQAAESFVARSRLRSSGGLSWQEVVLSLVTAMVGAGVLALPSLMPLAGWYMGPIIALCTALCFVEVGTFMHDAISAVDKDMPAGENIMTYDDFAHAAMGQLGVRLVQQTVTTMFFGYMVVYQVIIASNIRVMLPMGVCSKPSLRTVLICVCPALCGLAMLKDMSSLSKLMPVGAAMSLGACVLICVAGVKDAQYRTDEWSSGGAWTAEDSLYNYWPKSLSAIGTVLAVLFAAFAVIGTVPTIRGQMQDTSEFPFAFRVSVGSVTAVYVICMLCAYYGYGNFVQDNATASMVRYPNNITEAMASMGADDFDFTGEASPVMSIIAAFMVTLGLLLSFPVYFQCVVASLERLSPEAAWAMYGRIENRLFRVALVVLTTVIAMSVPYFRLVLAVLAAVCCSCNNVFWALLFSYKANAEAASTSTPRKVLHAFILAVGAICLVLGLIDAVTGLIQKLNGPPPVLPCPASG
eukprot:TRINITY_DN91048_c0_g1_i1.p1 TRINITY_DN91048_c0_g1~~TRINITY_DN91048_c0_g1_i1.p1  ORF type:complete len:501 (-),score=43.80 TRINITY_DN91048_c0_g1_i1:42-1544(-)